MPHLHQQRRAERNRAWLDVEHLDGKISGRSARGGIFTMLAYVYEFGTRTAAMLILARILAPSEIGLVAIVMLVSSFFMMFADVGLTAATIQAPQLSQAQASNLFWINGLLGLGLAVLACLAAPLVSWFFGEPEVVPMLCLSALGFVACGLSFQHRALLQRQMRFERFGLINVIALTLGLGAAIVLAKAGWGAYSLVLQNLIIYVAGLALAWAACNWRPGLPDRTCSVRPMVRFGGAVFGSNILNFLARQLDKLIVGRRWGAVELGLYQYGFRISTLPGSMAFEPLGKVAVPALSRLREKPEEYARYYLRMVEVVCVLTVPFAWLLFACPAEVVYLALGDNWKDCVPLVRAFSGLVLVNPLLGTTLWLFISRGQGRRMLQWLSISCSSFLVCLGIGALFEIESFVWIYSATIIGLAIPCLMFAIHGTRIQLVAIAKIFSRACLGGMVAAALTYFLARPLLVDAGTGRVMLAMLLIGGFSLVYMLFMCAIFRSHRIVFALLKKLRTPEAV